MAISENVRRRMAEGSWTRRMFEEGTRLKKELGEDKVFDLSLGGPRLGLDLYKKVHNLRILACGGDGTAGWVLSTIDEIGIQPGEVDLPGLISFSLFGPALGISEVERRLGTPTV